jgi:menaquinone-dependent protoporphyrinogen oxidase
MSPTMLQVLVTAASKHGATQGIAEALTRALREQLAAVGATVDEVPVVRDPSPERYTAVVLGSAVYAGSWRDEARHWATEHAGSLRDRAVWLFSSGPIGEPPFPPDEPHDVAPLLTVTGARQHRVFPGRLDKQLLTFPERAMVTAMRAPLGDFRDWAAVHAWAAEIAADLAVPASTATAGPDHQA